MSLTNLTRWNTAMIPSYAWDAVCHHVDSIGVAAAAEIIEACRSELIERIWAKHAPAPDDVEAVEPASAAFSAGLRDAYKGQDHDLSKPLELVLCPTPS